jgi:hypothetical protein
MNDNSELIDQSEVQMRKGMLVYCVLLLLKDGKVYTSEIIRSLRRAELIVGKKANKGHRANTTG